MKELSGSLCIKNLENVNGKDEALESKLYQKSHLRSLELVWSCNDGMNSQGSLQLEVLEGLVLPPQLMGLKIEGFKSATYPRWLLESLHFENLESFKLVNCSALERLPINTELFRHCSELLLKNVPSLKALSCLPAELTHLSITSCPLLMFIMNAELEQHDQSENITRTEYLASQLASIWEVDSGEEIRKVISSDHSSLKQLMTLMDTDMSHLQTISNAENDTTILKEDIIKAWICCHQKRIRFIYGRHIGMPLVPPSGLRRLDLSSCSITDGALAVCLDGLTSLRDLSLVEIMTLTTLPSQEVFQHLHKLEYLIIRNCWCFRSLGGLRVATSLLDVTLISCPSLDLEGGADLIPSVLKSLIICSSVVAANLFSSWSGCLAGLNFFSMFGCRSSASLSIGHLTSLKSLILGGMPDLCFLEGLSSLQLQHVSLTDVPKLTAECIGQFRVQKSLYVSSLAMLNQMLLAEGFTVPPFLSLQQCKETFVSFKDSANFTSVKHLRLCKCEMRSLPGNLKCFSSLTKLDIYDCPNISSLPDLPSSLQHICFWVCERLIESCLAPDGESWPKIAHVRWKEFRSEL
ncbi:hypothetical protein ACQ4PT_038774 [Festuca glaucescens]